jgi:hypothetical protein
MKTKINLSISLFLAFTIPAFSQNYYPAGLGDSNLQLWLTTADSTTLLNASGTEVSNGGSVATWKDKSGNGADAVQMTASAQPIYNSNQLNGFGALVFQNNGQYMTGPTGAYQTIVSTRSMLGTSYQYLFSSPANSDFSVRFTGGTSTVHYTDGPNVNDWCYNTGTTPAQWVNGVQSLAGSTNTHILVDQAANATNATYSLSSTFMSRGMYNNDPVYELLAYKTTLNTTQRILLENYEAAEWGLTSNLPSSGYTKFTPPSISTFNKNLVGIGYTSGTDNFLADVAGSTDGLGFSSGTTASDFLQSAGYIMAAHNGQTNTVAKNPILNNVPVNSYVWNRSWYVQHTGGNNSGNVTLNFNFNDYNGSTPNPNYYYSILYNPSDGTFTTGTNTLVTMVSRSISGNIASFVVNASNLANGYYTVIYNQANTLPLMLKNFSVTKQSSLAEVKWETTQEINTDHFDIQRSVDGLNYITIGTEKARGNSSIAFDYDFIDNQPVKGLNYYRLGMVGQNGAFAYSITIKVDFSDIQSTLKFYPNPTSDILHINIPGANTAGSVQLYNTAGQLVGTYQSSSLDGMSISTKNIQKGLYFIKVNGEFGSIVQRIIKE